MKTHLYSAFYSYFTECLIYNSCNTWKHVVQDTN